MIKLYDYWLSGNCHKVRMMLSILKLEHELVPINIKELEQKSLDFLQLNPFGMVPVLIDGAEILRDSQAILFYLGMKYGGDWLPRETVAMSKVVQWLSTSAQDIQNSFAAARVHFLLGRELNVALAQQRAYSLLKTMDKYLENRHWLEGDRPTIADIACFPYIALAGDAKISLDDYLNVVAWLERVKQIEGFISMEGML
jgi:glutathione S-transferase